MSVAVATRAMDRAAPKFDIMANPFSARSPSKRDRDPQSARTTASPLSVLSNRSGNRPHDASMLGRYVAFVYMRPCTEARRLISDLTPSAAFTECGQHIDRQPLEPRSPVGMFLRRTAWASNADRRAACLTPGLTHQPSFACPKTSSDDLMQRRNLERSNTRWTTSLPYPS
jgi:hypothetical protein